MRIVCGLDVHKDSIFLCIMSSTGEIFEKKYGVLTNQLEEMRDLMLTYHVQEVGMERTSVYWVPVWRILEPHFNLKLINPYFIKQLPGHKSDVKDAQWIAECMMKELVRGSFVPLSASSSSVCTTVAFTTLMMRSSVSWPSWMRRCSGVISV